jgi:hypothetical protein
MAARRVEDVQIERTADEILILKEGHLEAHALNQCAATVYDLCDGNTSKSEMAVEIHRRTGLPADEEVPCDSARADSAVGAVVDISVDAASCRNRCGTAGGGAGINITGANADTYTNNPLVRRSCRRFWMGVTRSFCCTCGSPLTYESERIPDEVHLYAASLLSPLDVKPSRHVFVEEQLPWLEIADLLPRFAKRSRGGAQPIRYGPIH